MKKKRPIFAWRAVTAFYLVLIFIITLLDWVNQVLSLQYWAVQIGLTTIGIAIFVIIGYKVPDLTAQRGVLLAFSVGVLTIIPAVLMGLNISGNLWEDYFTIGLSMAAGSFLGFLFIKLTSKVL